MTKEYIEALEVVAKSVRELRKDARCVSEAPSSDSLYAFRFGAYTRVIYAMEHLDKVKDAMEGK